MLSWWRQRSIVQRGGMAGAGVLVCVATVIAGAVSGPKDGSGGRKAAVSPSPTAGMRTATPTGLPAPDATSLAPAAARRKAAAICRSANAYYRTEFNDGVTVILNRPAHGGYPPFSAWYRKAENGDQQMWKNASAEVDDYFTAADAPPSTRDWYDDNGLLSADLAMLAHDGLDADGPPDAAARQAVQEAVAHFREDFADAQKDADRIEAGT
jgi:hypothetical protein